MNITIHQIAVVTAGYEYFFSVYDDESNLLLGNQTEFAGTTEPDQATQDAWKAAYTLPTASSTEIETYPPIITATDIINFDTEVTSNATVMANTTAKHIHANATILNNTEQSFTTELKTKVLNVENNINSTSFINALIFG